MLHSVMETKMKGQNLESMVSKHENSHQVIFVSKISTKQQVWILNQSNN